MQPLLSPWLHGSVHWPTGDRVSAISISAINIAFALAPAFGMALINHFDFPILFLVCAGLSLGSLFITLKLRSEKIDSLDSRSVKDQPLLSREALPPAIMAFMGSLIRGAVTAFFPLYSILHGVSNPGLFFGALAITLILARGLGGKILDLYEREKILLPCLAAQIIAMAPLAFSTNLSMFILVAVIWGLGNAFFYPTLVAHAIDLCRSFSRTSHWHLYGPFRFRGRHGSGDHGHRLAVDQLSHHVSLPLFHRSPQSLLFPVHRQKKERALKIPCALLIAQILKED